MMLVSLMTFALNPSPYYVEPNMAQQNSREGNLGFQNCCDVKDVVAGPDSCCKTT